MFVWMAFITDVRRVILDMDRIHNDILVHDKYVIYVVNGATTTSAVKDGGLQLSGSNQYAEMKARDAACDGDVTNCLRGFTLRFKMRADVLLDSTHFVSSPFVDVFYRDGRLVAEVRTPTTIWRTSTTSLQPGVWYQVTVVMIITDIIIIIIIITVILQICIAPVTQNRRTAIKHEPCLPLLPAAEHHHPLAGTHCTYPRRDGQAELTWVVG